jgi:hypothetical protein
MKNLNINFDIFLFDSISKFNFYNKINLVKLNKLKIYVKLKSMDSAFLKNFLYLSQIFFDVFNRKIIILKILKDKNKIKNSITFYMGFSVNNIVNIFDTLNYLLNIILFSAKKSDSSFNFKKKNNNFLYFFKNINYFLGLNFLKFSK